MIDRRRFLASVPILASARMLSTVVAPTAAANPAVATSRRPGGPEGSARLASLGVQLYTVREAMVADADRTLATLAEIGYREVELAGLYGHSPRDFRAKLDAVGLRAVSSHHGLDAVRGEWARTIDGALELGQSLIVVPSISDDERTAEGLARVADDFDRAGAAAKAVGLRFGYHNHDWELAPTAGGTLPMDFLLDRTDPALVDWQMDIFWAVQGGADPVALLARRGRRVTSVHVKDRTASGAMVDVGDGVLDFTDLVGRAEQTGLRHAFVEHDQPNDALRSVRRSFDFLAPRLGLSGGTR